MRDDFCAFILTHGRPDKVLTYPTVSKNLRHSETLYEIGVHIIMHLRK